jgi:hypothetical protein
VFADDLRPSSDVFFRIVASERVIWTVQKMKADIEVFV